MRAVPRPGRDRRWDRRGCPVGRWGVVLALGWAAGCTVPGGPNLQQLAPHHVTVVQRIVADLEALVTARRAAGTIPLLTDEELVAPLDRDERRLLHALQRIHPRQLQGASQRLPPVPRGVALVPLAGQVVQRDGRPIPLDTQYLPRDVARAYKHVMRAMQWDLGRYLRVESGFRSPAYQLFLFVESLGNHDYSIRETNRFVALPGYSEHGCPLRQALDFIAEDGVNGDGNPEAFEMRPEYAWLQAHGPGFGFVLSFPRHHPSGTSFEPWHWHYEPPQLGRAP